MNLIYKFESINNNEDRFVALDGETEAGEITFTKAGETILIIDHTFVNDNYRGKKIGNELVKHVVDHAIEQGKKIVPLCPFAKKEFDKNPEYQKIQK